MTYIIAGEALAIAVLWGLWWYGRSKRLLLESSVRLTAGTLAKTLANADAEKQRYAAELAGLKTELTLTRKELDARSTPDSVRGDVARLLAR